MYQSIDMVYRSINVLETTVLGVFKVFERLDYWHLNLGYLSARLTNIRTRDTWALDRLAFGLGYSALDGRMF